MNKIPRVVFLGSTFVGKTSIINRIVEDSYNPDVPPTTGAGYFSFRPKNYGGKEIQIWDTAGMERYRSMNAVYYRDALGAVLTFDLTSLSSFNDLESWYNDLLNAAKAPPFIVLVGNKSDLIGKSRTVDEEVINDFCRSHQDIPYFETSALNGSGIRQMVDALVSGLPQSHELMNNMNDNEDNQTSCC